MTPTQRVRPVILATAPLRGDGLRTLESMGELVHEPWIDDDGMHILDEHELAARIDDTGATLLICEVDTCKGPVLERPLTAIASTRGDPTNVDVEGATAAGIPVLRAPGRNADAVAELTIGLLFAVTRHLIVADREVRAGDTYKDGTIPYQRFRAWELAGRTAGIVGLGAVGKAAQWRYEGLGMKTIACDPYNPAATHSLDELLAEADVISMHAPPVPETFGMIGAEQFRLMKSSAVYLNTARASLHDVDALVDALTTGQIAGAALDHFDGEFLAADHPLTQLSNVVLTPHIGGATYDTEANHTSMVAADLQRLLAGERPVHCVNPEVLEGGDGS